MSDVQVSPPCRHCGHPGPHTETILDDGMHFGRLDCPECQRFLKWLPKPESESSKHRRTAAHRSLVEKFSRGHCELCLIKKEFLPKGETLHAHHVQAHEHEGPPTRENVWILCTGCHSLVEWRRTYQKHILEKLGGRLTNWMSNG